MVEALKKRKKRFLFEEKPMKKRTWDLIILATSTILEIIKIFKEKINGRKEDDRKRGSKKKPEE